MMDLNAENVSNNVTRDRQTVDTHTIKQFNFRSLAPFQDGDPHPSELLMLWVLLTKSVSVAQDDIEDSFYSVGVSIDGVDQLVQGGFSPVQIVYVVRRRHVICPSYIPCKGEENQGYRELNRLT